MVFLYPPPEYFTHISKTRQEAEDKLLKDCIFVQYVDTCLDYYRLPDTQDIRDSIRANKIGIDTHTHSKNEPLLKTFGMLMLWIPKALMFCILGAQRVL